MASARAPTRLPMLLVPPDFLTERERSVRPSSIKFQTRTEPVLIGAMPEEEQGESPGEAQERRSLPPPPPPSVQISSLSVRSTALLPEPDDCAPGLPLAVRATAMATATATVQCSSSAPAGDEFAGHVDEGDGGGKGELDEASWKQPKQERAGPAKLLQIAQAKLLEHGFSALDENALSEAETELVGTRPMQVLLQDAVRRIVEILEQYGRRGQLVQELILSAETAARRNERLSVDNKKLALQITDLTQQPARAPPTAEGRRDEQANHVQRLEAALQDAQRECEAARERAREELAQLQAQLVDVKQDLAVSLKREAGNSSELRRLEHERATERHALEARVEAARRKELSVYALVQDKEQQLERCQERLRSVVEDEERRRQDALALLKTFPRRGTLQASNGGSSPPGRRSGGEVGGLGGDVRAAAVVASLLDRLNFQDKEVAVLQKENRELGSYVRQLQAQN